jgi:hypothetical protein
MFSQLYWVWTGAIPMTLLNQSWIRENQRYRGVKITIFWAVKPCNVTGIFQFLEKHSASVFRMGEENYAEVSQRKTTGTFASLVSFRKTSWPSYPESVIFILYCSFCYRCYKIYRNRSIHMPFAFKPTILNTVSNLFKNFCDWQETRNSLP